MLLGAAVVSFAHLPADLLVGAAAVGHSARHVGVVGAALVRLHGHLFDAGRVTQVRCRHSAAAARHSRHTRRYINTGVTREDVYICIGVNSTCSAVRYS